MRPTGLSADGRFNSRLTVQTRVDKSVRYYRWVAAETRVATPAQISGIYEIFFFFKI